MTIKKLVHTAQRTAQDTSGSSFKLGHVYEILAATLGFGSYAALCANHVFDEDPDYRVRTNERSFGDTGARALELGYTREAAVVVAATIRRAVEERGIRVRELDDVVASARQGYGFVNDFYANHEREDFDDEDGGPDFDQAHGDADTYSAVLRESLERAAAADDHRAHYALSLAKRGEPFIQFLSICRRHRLWPPPPSLLPERAEIDDAVRVQQQDHLCVCHSSRTRKLVA